MLMRGPAGGFTLIELAVTMAVFAILVVAGLPSFATWVHDSQIRSTAELLQNGLRQAQAEAVDRSRVVVFALTNAQPGFGAATAADGANWYAQALPQYTAECSLTTYQQDAYIAGGGLGGLDHGTTVTGPTMLCFSSIGHLVAYSGTVAGVTYACSVPSAGALESYDVANPQGDHPLRVTVSFGGQIRLCDPSRTLSSSNPDGC